MDHLTDTNVLLRRMERHHPQHREARIALNALRRRGDRLCIVSQNLTELWSVSTRPAAQNGIGLTPGQANWVIEQFEAVLTFLPESELVHREWRRLVVQHAVSGKKVYDTRLVAAMNVHGVKHILTFNVQDFVRYPGIAVVHPRDLAHNVPKA